MSNSGSAPQEGKAIRIMTYIAGQFATMWQDQIICLSDILNFEVFFELPKTSSLLSSSVDHMNELARVYLGSQVELSAGRHFDPATSLEGHLLQAKQCSLELKKMCTTVAWGETSRTAFNTAIEEADRALDMAYSRCRLVGICK